MIGDDEGVAGVADDAKHRAEGLTQRVGGDHLVRRSVGENPPARSEHEDAIAETQGQIQIVEDDRDADGTITGGRSDEVDAPQDMAGVHGGERLVGEQESLESRIVDLEEGPGEGGSLALPGAESSEGLVGTIPEFDPGQRPEDLVACRTPARESPHGGDLGEAVGEGDPRMLGDQRDSSGAEGYRHIVDACFSQHHGAALRTEDSRADAQERGFACTVGAADGDDLAGSQTHRDIVEDGTMGEGMGNLAGLECGRAYHGWDCCKCGERVMADDGGVVAVAGATGFVGRHAVKALLERGRRVRALVRCPEKGGRVLPQHEALEIVVGEVLEAGSVEALVAGADALVNCIGIIREAPGGQTFDRVHVRTTRRLVHASRDAGVRRFVQVSALGVRDEAPTAYFRTKFEGEQIVRHGGVGWTILRPSMILGEGSAFVEMARGWISGKASPHVFVPYFRRHVGGPPIPGLARLEDAKLQPIAVEDVAEAIATSLERDEAQGELYQLTGPETLTMREILERIRSATPLAKDLPMVGMPHTVAAGLAELARRVGLGYALPFDRGMAIMASEDSVAPMDKARAQLGLETHAVTLA